MQPSKLTLEILNEHYVKVKPEVQSRLKEFFRPKTRTEIFRELCFCILTAGASAELGIKTMACLPDDVVTSGNQEKIHDCLKGVYRFHNLRANYIALAKDSFDKINLDSPNIREELVKNIKGLGYKESSHFLRNIGKKGYAILDKHVIKLLNDLEVIDNSAPPKNPKQYLEIEEKMKIFAKEIEIDFDELDLVLWSYKTGKVLK